MLFVFSAAITFGTSFQHYYVQFECFPQRNANTNRRRRRFFELLKVPYRGIRIKPPEAENLPGFDISCNGNASTRKILDQLKLNEKEKIEVSEVLLLDMFWDFTNMVTTITHKLSQLIYYFV